MTDVIGIKLIIIRSQIQMAEMSAGGGALASETCPCSDVLGKRRPPRQDQGAGTCCRAASFHLSGPPG